MFGLGFQSPAGNGTPTPPPTWDPSSLSNKVAWFRGDLGTSTTTNGANVATWADQYSLQGAFDSTTASVKPTYLSSAINGKPGIKGNSSSCWMISPSSSAWNLTTGFSIVMVGIFNSNTTNDCYLSKGNSTNWDFYDTSGVSSPKNISCNINAGSHTSSTSSLLANNAPFCVQFDLTSGGTLDWTVNGNSLGSATSVGTPTGNSQGVYLFVRQDQICISQVTWCEIIVTSVPITGSDLTSLKSYINTRYAITMV